MIKLNRKPNGEVLGLPVFLGQEVIADFVSEKTKYVEIEKKALKNGVFLKFIPISEIIKKPDGFVEPVFEK